MDAVATVRCPAQEHGSEPVLKGAETLCEHDAMAVE
jgi:hypothetical protein